MMEKETKEVKYLSVAGMYWVCREEKVKTMTRRARLGYPFAREREGGGLTTPGQSLDKLVANAFAIFDIDIAKYP